MDSNLMKLLEFCNEIMCKYSQQIVLCASSYSYLVLVFVYVVHVNHSCRSQRGRSNRDNILSPSRLSPNNENRRQIAKDQQVELINFSQNVHLLNQEMHKNLRRNKAGVRLEDVDLLPLDYRRPPGFVLVPGLLGTIPGGDDPMIHINRKRANSKEKLIELSYRDFGHSNNGNR